MGNLECNIFSTVCGGYLYEPQGVITSPNYPNAYDNNLDCRWIVQVGRGRTIGFEFDNLNVPSTSATCEEDYVMVSTFRGRS